MSEINYQEVHETVGQEKPVAWRYRYVKKGVTDFQEKMWVGDWKYVPTKEDCNDRPNYEIQALFTAPPVPVISEGLGKADNPLASSNQVGELTMWVKRLAHCLKYANSLSSLPDKAMEYLNQNGLISAEDIMR
ncbi:hypothetical protein [Escherichia coli]|uniref:hypothetical protein n=1 Tax=Escherichia coli TaxID=562 RepID=UPI00107C302C|nr:hypothetical protein [Escherichia coli]EAC2053824.1 hypothetical protein [Escherichia coli]EFI5218299.1 hypothetical protein [Escherichia coli]EIM2760699.1 hypothetical protein [Escherichia coli]HAH7685627.1 hypothetical protein [Escherichia coli]HAH7783795.1 hypothetical protein [Escherichia coli]